MKNPRTIAGPVAAAALAAALAACGGQAGNTASPATGATGHTATATSQPSCAAQYQTWKVGPADKVAHQLTSHLGRVKRAASTKDLLALSTWLQRIGRDARALGKYPIPACADPHHYYVRFLGLLRAAGDNASTGGGGIGSLFAAMAPLQQLNAVEGKLSRELHRTVHLSN